MLAQQAGRPRPRFVASFLTMQLSCCVLFHCVFPISASLSCGQVPSFNLSITARDSQPSAATYPPCSDGQASEYMRIFNKCKPCMAENGNCPKDCCASASANVRQALWCEIGKCCARAAAQENSRSALLFLDGVTASGSAGGKCTNSLKVSSNCDKCAFASDKDGIPLPCNNYPFFNTDYKYEAPVQCQLADASDGDKKSGDNNSGNTREDASSCFSASSIVQLQSGDRIRMDELAVGDRVQVAPNSFSTVFMFTHKVAHVQANFVRISTHSGPTITLTPGHYIYANGNLVAASTVKPGDSLIMTNGDFTTVRKVSQVRGKGIYNPQTYHGDIIVDDILASTYTMHFCPQLAHASLLPLRWLHAMTGFTTRLLDRGAGFVASFVPTGTFLYI